MILHRSYVNRVEFFLGMVAFLLLITLVGFIYMFKKNCHCSFSCCQCLKDLEKRDVNQIYGDYYYADGERRKSENEVIY